jgi:S-adenosylmethionine synthetase
MDTKVSMVIRVRKVTRVTMEIMVTTANVLIKTEVTMVTDLTLVDLPAYRRSFHAFLQGPHNSTNKNIGRNKIGLAIPIIFHLLNNEPR